MKIKRIGIGLLLVFGLAAASGVTYSQAPSEGVARFRLELSRVPHTGEIRESVLKLVVKLTNTSGRWPGRAPNECNEHREAVPHPSRGFIARWVGWESTPPASP